MAHLDRQAERLLLEELRRIKNLNGSQQTIRLQQRPPQPAPADYPDPYEDDPDFQMAVRCFKDGKLDAAMSLVDRVLVRYPGDKNLEKFKSIIQHQIPEAAIAYRDHPSYITLRENIKRREWAAGLEAADVLLMSYPNVQAISDTREQLYRRVQKQEFRTRIRLIGTIGFLALLLVTLGSVVFRYIREPGSLAEILIPNASLRYPPHYLFSIHDADQPVGVGLSPDGERIYVTEMGGTRMVRIFDRSGKSLGSFASPETNAGQRAPVYVATDNGGRVYVSDRLQHAIFVFSPEGAYIDTFLGPGLTLSEYVKQHAGGETSGGAYAYNLFNESVSITASSNAGQSLALPQLPEWSPLGIRFGQDNKMILTDVSKNNNRVIEISLGDQISPQEWIDFDPATTQYGTSGNGNGEMLFPNSAVADSQGRVYVSDGNNRRISVWDSEGNFVNNFGSGNGPGSLSLPRGLFVDRHDRLYVVDTVAQNVKVYDVSGSQPTFLFEFGEFGNGDGLFNYPNDIAVDRSGRIYIADRENNLIQVWSY